MNSLEVTDAESKAVQKTPNRVTLDHILGQIYLERYFTLGEALENSTIEADRNRLSNTTVCVLMFKNGFVQMGTSTPADPANFNPETGRKFAREAAIREAWPKFGFELCERLFQRQLDGLDG